MTQIGLMIEGQIGLTWARWRRLLDACEQFGYQCLFRSDHYTIGPPDEESLETWVSLTYAAEHTSRIEFGPLVSPVTFRHPSLLARMAAAVDDLSGGRLVLGVGAGWHEREHRQFGIPFYDRSTRFEMLQDELEILNRFFHNAGPVSYQGKHVSLEDAVLLPRPERPGGPPILIGGKGRKKTLPFVARYADEWNGLVISPQTYRELNDHLNQLLVEQGRDPHSVKRSLMTAVLFGSTDAEVQQRVGRWLPNNRPEERATRIIGTPGQVIDRIGEYVEAGVERFMLQWLDIDDIDGIERMARDVLPHFHA